MNMLKWNLVTLEIQQRVVVVVLGVVDGVISGVENVRTLIWKSILVLWNVMNLNGTCHMTSQTSQTSLMIILCVKMLIKKVNLFIVGVVVVGVALREYNGGQSV